MNDAVDLRPQSQSRRDWYLRVERVGRPVAPWVWRIYAADDTVMHEARQGYFSAEDAMKIGEVFLQGARSGRLVSAYRRADVMQGAALALAKR
jgi:hypothetical protein